MTKRYLAIGILAYLLSLPVAESLENALIAVLAFTPLEIVAVRILSNVIVAMIVYRLLCYLLKERRVSVKVDNIPPGEMPPDEILQQEGTPMIYRGKGLLRCPFCRAEMIGEQWHVCPPVHPPTGGSVIAQHPESKRYD